MKVFLKKKFFLLKFPKKRVLKRTRETKIKTWPGHQVVRKWMWKMKKRPRKY